MLTVQPETWRRADRGVHQPWGVARPAPSQRHRCEAPPGVLPIRRPAAACRCPVVSGRRLGGTSRNRICAAARSRPAPAAGRTRRSSFPAPPARRERPQPALHGQARAIPVAVSPRSIPVHFVTTRPRPIGFVSLSPQTVTRSAAAGSPAPVVTLCLSCRDAVPVMLSHRARCLGRFLPGVNTVISCHQGQGGQGGGS